VGFAYSAVLVKNPRISDNDINSTNATLIHICGHNDYFLEKSDSENSVDTDPLSGKLVGEFEVMRHIAVENGYRIHFLKFLPSADFGHFNNRDHVAHAIKSISDSQL
jgi:hypothetical protein